MIYHIHICYTQHGGMTYQDEVDSFPLRGIRITIILLSGVLQQLTGSEQLLEKQKS